MSKNTIGWLFVFGVLMFSGVSSFASEWWTQWYPHSHEGVRNCGGEYIEEFTAGACTQKALEQARPGENLKVVMKDTRNVKDEFGKTWDNKRWCKVRFEYRCQLATK